MNNWADAILAMIELLPSDIGAGSNSDPGLSHRKFLPSISTVNLVSSSPFDFFLYQEQSNNLAGSKNFTESAKKGASLYMKLIVMKSIY